MTVWHLFPILDFEGLQRDVTGILRWRPQEFWTSILYDVRIASEGIVEEYRQRLRAEAHNAAWIVNNMPAAVGSLFKKNGFKGLSVDDLFGEGRSGTVTKDEAERIRERVRTRADKVKPPGYFWTSGESEKKPVRFEKES